jgi:hypothetical protein
MQSLFALLLTRVLLLVLLLLYCSSLPPPTYAPHFVPSTNAPRFDPPTFAPRFDPPTYTPRFDPPAYAPRFDPPHMFLVLTLLRLLHRVSTPLHVPPPDLIAHCCVPLQVHAGAGVSHLQRPVDHRAVLGLRQRDALLDGKSPSVAHVDVCRRVNRSR